MVKESSEGFIIMELLSFLAIIFVSVILLWLSRTLVKNIIKILRFRYKLRSVPLFLFKSSSFLVIIVVVSMVAFIMAGRLGVIDCGFGCFVVYPLFFVIPVSIANIFNFISIDNE